MLITLLALWLTSAVTQAQPAKNAEAQRHYDAGLAYVDEPNGPKWEEALREFRAAYTASGQWKLQNNIGLCALNLERDEEAIEAYQDYLARSGDELAADKRRQIEKDVATLSAGLVRVELEVIPVDATVLDERRNSKGELVSNRYTITEGKISLGLHPGHHQLTLEAAGHQSEEWSFEAEPASKHSRQFRLVPKSVSLASPSAMKPSGASLAPAALPRSERRTPTSVYVGLIATGGFTAAATTTGILTFGKNKDFQASVDPVEQDSLAKSGRTYALLTDVGIGAAVLSAGVTAYLYLTAPKSAATAAVPRKFRVSPVVGPGTTCMTLTGAF
jgi:hypothetical protein